METQHHTIHGRANPFWDLDRPFEYQVETGKTIAEIVESSPLVPAWFSRVDDGVPAGVVRINGRKVDRGAWHIMRPKLGTAQCPIIITLHPAYHGGSGGGRGGGGGSKNVIGTVAAIALVAAATAVSAGALAGPAATLGITGFGIGGEGCGLQECPAETWKQLRPQEVIL